MCLDLMINIFKLVELEKSVSKDKNKAESCDHEYYDVMMCCLPYGVRIAALCDNFSGLCD